MTDRFKSWFTALSLGLGLCLGQPAWAQDEFADEFSGDSAAADQSAAMEAPKGLEWSGFLQLERAGHVGPESSMQRQWLLEQTRFRLKTNQSNPLGNLYLKLDFLENGVTQSATVDVREARLTATPFSWMDLSLGKQVNTWGVGDMLFVNDLFPKNWMAMFLGQDMEFMKEPADSYRMSLYLGSATLDVVSHPKFAPDRTPNGCVFAIYNPNSMLDSNQPALAGSPDNCGAAQAGNVIDGSYGKGENAVRLKTDLGGFEWALYGYRGFYKSPKGMKLDNGSLSPIYPRLATQGASLEGQLGPGILSMEAGAYDSLDDPEGTDPLIENSKNKALIGYRMDLNAYLSLGLQSYQEQMLQYAEYEDGILGMYRQMGYSESQAEATPAYVYRRKEVQRTHTLRVTFKAQQETLWVNLFHYERPDDKDHNQEYIL